jgi:hypothetical protein
MRVEWSWVNVLTGAFHILILTYRIVCQTYGVPVTLHGLQPHREWRFKLSTDPKYAKKLRDVVGLYVDPPAHAIVLSFDEKSQIQSLDRT